eukprot:2286182-Amphidinium_carterae.1
METKMAPQESTSADGTREPVEPDMHIGQNHFETIPNSIAYHRPTGFLQECFAKCGLTCFLPGFCQDSGTPNREQCEGGASTEGGHLSDDGYSPNSIIETMLTDEPEKPWTLMMECAERAILLIGALSFHV